MASDFQESNSFRVTNGPPTYVVGYAMRELKAALRSTVRQRLNAMSPIQRMAASCSARAILEQQSIWAESHSILFFAPLPDEPDLWPSLTIALTAGKQVFLPRFDGDTTTYTACQIKTPKTDLRIGQFGIREPIASCPQFPLNHLDLILVPGVAFDLHGRRLGRGKGFYDHLLAAVRGKTCGVAFDEQIVDEVPVEPHDVLLNCILTPSRWIQL